MPEAGESFRSLLRTTRVRRASVRKEKTGAKAIEIIAIIAVGSRAKTSLKPAWDSADIATQQGESPQTLLSTRKNECEWPPRLKRGGSFCLPEKRHRGARHNRPVILLLS